MLTETPSGPSISREESISSEAGGEGWIEPALPRYPESKLWRWCEKSWPCLDDSRTEKMAEGWTGPAGSGCPGKGGV